MAMMIGENCIGCSGCVDECPNMAIAFGEDNYVIDPSKCTECVGVYDEPQCAALCPTESIVPNPELHEDRGRLMEKRRLLLAS